MSVMKSMLSVYLHFSASNGKRSLGPLVFVSKISEEKLSLMPCLRIFLNVLFFNVLCSKAKQLRTVLRHA